MANRVAEVDETAKVRLTWVTGYDSSLRIDGRDDQSEEGVT